MSVIEPQEPRSLWVVQRKSVAQAVGTFRGRLHPLDLELEPIALFEMVDAPVEAQQKFKRVFVGNGTPSLHIISRKDIDNSARIQGLCFARH